MGLHDVLFSQQFSIPLSLNVSLAKVTQGSKGPISQCLVAYRDYSSYGVRVGVVHAPFEVRVRPLQC